jgi:2-polyprenyl-6-methoxyphenol hydroxylase-like FAD-dependent oxidoreductase
MPTTRKESAVTTYDEHVPVLIVGGGYAGLASSMFLSQHGVRSLLVDRHPGVSIQGRARGINQRTLEIYRPLGLEPAITEAGKPFDDEGGVARCSSLAGEWEWLFDEEAPRFWPDLSAGQFVMADQNTVEPILIEKAVELGAEQRFHTQMTSFTQDPDGVTAVIENRDSGETRTVRADYMIGADGHRSPIREELGINRPGPGITQYWVSIVFEADLSDVIKKKALFWIVLSQELGFASFVTTATPGRWAVSVTYDPAKDSPEAFTDERCVSIARTVVGKDDLDVSILDVGAWEQAVGVADHYREDRVFLAGDAAHVWPPAGAMGANTGVQDAHNLAWKLAATVNGYGSDDLLDAYEAERRPVAVELSQLIIRRQEARFSGNPEVKDDLDDVVATLGQHYLSTAMVGAEHEQVFGREVEQHARPGFRAPHLWLDHNGNRIGVHDLFHNSFVLLTGNDGAGWVEAATAITESTEIPVRGYQVGSAEAHANLIDLDNEWENRYEVGTSGAVLVRPDGYVAWLSTDAADKNALGDALNQVLGR